MTTEEYLGAIIPWWISNMMLVIAILWLVSR
jgi:hypothetical protein